MTGGYLTTAVLTAGVLSTTIVATPPVLLIWNTTASMAPGLYRVTHGKPTRGQLAVARLPPSVQARAVTLGYILPRTPVVKRIAAATGDLVCRFGLIVAINGRPVATAYRRDRYQRKLPAWHGCRRLASNEVFLLGRHADSFDGRYFGPTDVGQCLGVARPILVQTNSY